MESQNGNLVHSRSKAACSNSVEGFGVDWQGTLKSRWGVYLLKTTLQLESTNAAAKNLSVWAKKNGTDEVYSAHEYDIEGSGKKDIINWNGSLVLSATDYVEIFWATNNTTIELHAHAAASPRPAVASASVAISFASNS